MKPAARMFPGMLLCVAAAGPLHAQQGSNTFNDPFVQVTAAMPACAVPDGPRYTEQEVREAAHVRAQHGGSCYNSGRCRLPNSYLYDKEIIPRVQHFLRVEGRFGNTSVWVMGERRLVTLMGCVGSREQSQAMEKAVWQVDDVMGVINLLTVGTQQAPRYRVVRP